MSHFDIAIDIFSKIREKYSSRNFTRIAVKSFSKLKGKMYKLEFLKFSIDYSQ